MLSWLDAYPCLTNYQETFKYLDYFNVEQLTWNLTEVTIICSLMPFYNSYNSS